LADLLVSEQGAGMELECDPATGQAAALRLRLTPEVLIELRKDAARVVAALT
jgi:hypothetical protein